MRKLGIVVITLLVLALVVGAISCGEEVAITPSPAPSTEVIIINLLPFVGTTIRTFTT